MINRFIAGKNFSVEKFYTDTGFIRKLNNLQAYAISAGCNEDVSEYSTNRYRVDNPERDLDHIDYPSYIYGN